MTGPASGPEAAVGRWRQLVLTETAIGMVVAGGVIPLILWLTRVPAPIRLGGSDGFVADAAKATIPAVFLMTLLITLELRVRGRTGRLGPLGTPALGWLARAPKGLLGRSLLCTVLALATFAPLRVVVCSLLGRRGLTATEFVPVNIVYGLLLGVIVTPPVVLAALADLFATRAADH